MKGADLVGRKYEPLFQISNSNFQAKNIYSVLPADFVSTEEGTGLVHIAPAFGEDDMKVGKENDLPVLITVDEEGRVKKNLSAKGCS